MAEFRTTYYGPMDREYHQSVTETPEPVSIEEPIFPISQLGETVPEQDPTGRFKNIIQTTQAAIRGGAGTVQLVMMTPPESAIGGRPKSYGKEVREALKEVALASNVTIAGVEMPTALNNLAGFDYQQLQFSDEKRKNSLDEVKDAIKFVADVARGGGVDIVSWEFPRGVNEASWNDGQFKQEGEVPIKFLVDDRNGSTIRIRTTEIQHLPFNKDENFRPIKPGEELQPFGWEDFKEWAKHNEKENSKLPKEKQLPTTPEGAYVWAQLQGRINTTQGWATYYDEQANTVARAKLKLSEELKTLEGEELKKKQDEVNHLARQEEHYRHSAYGNIQQVRDTQEQLKHIKPIKNYALDRSTKTYAEAGIAAMNATIEGQAKGTVTKPIYVGPELGWPGYYGSHPDEFVELIKGAREKMVQLMTQPIIKVITPQGQEEDHKNQYWNPTLSKHEAEERAKKHIKGLFDTSHMGMWLAHFEPLKDESTGRIIETEEQRIARFNNWYTEQVKKIANDPDNLVGGIQLVDSQSAAHGHLPPGQGIFPVKETAQIFKNAGYSGFLVSEGHEEEKFGEGRIRTKTWQMAGGAPLGNGYFSGPPLRWGQVQNNYFGKTYSPMFIFGGYSPSNEFKLWSEVPLE